MEKLNIAAMWFPVNTLGYGKRLGVWVQGCSKNCRGCISPEFRDNHINKLLTAEEILAHISEDMIPDGITISGGEPFEQEKGILELVKLFKERFSDDILIYSGYKLNELKAKKSAVTDEILSNISVLIDGEYIESQNDGSALKGSANQKIHIFRNKELYDEIINNERKIEGIFIDDRIWFIGIPPLNF